MHEPSPAPVFRNPMLGPVAGDVYGKPRPAGERSRAGVRDGPRDEEWRRMALTAIALDLERTLIDDAMSGRARPGLRRFLQFCDERFARVVLFTTVDEADAREVMA